jgi:predicted SAM-dependent methyltransferase
MRTNPIYKALRKIKWTLTAFRTNPPWKRAKISETSKCRATLAKFCKGDGVDIGFGGDPIVPNAICMDLPSRYASYTSHVQHLHGSADNLHWFKDRSLDWVYSSHVLEDFAGTAHVLNEWLRVIKPGGVLILYLPHEQTYRQHCIANGRPPNAHHIHENFGPDLIRNEIRHRHDTKVIHERFPVGIYSFEMVIQKIK